MDALLLAYLGALVHRNAGECVDRTPDGVREWTEEFLRDAQLRAEVASSLERMGACAAGCLIELLADEDALVREWSERALIAMGKDALRSLTQAVERCEPGDETALRRVMDAIGVSRVAG